MSALVPTTTSVLKNWKSTLSGILTVSLATSAALAPQPWVGNHPKFAATVGTVQVLAKVYIALLEKD